MIGTNNEDCGSTPELRHTLKTLQPYLPQIGITRVANITGLDTIGIPVWTVVRPLGRSLSVSQGKGLTDDLAIISGVMESIEVFYAEQPKPHAIRRPLLEHKRDDRFISPSRLAIRSDAALSHRRHVEWIEGEDLLEGGTRWLPLELFDLDFSRDRSSAPVFLASSNGLAAGKTGVDATVHGLCEVIERDQISFWSAKKKQNRRLKLKSITDVNCQGLVEKCIGAGLDVFVWYVTVNIDVPVFMCTIVDQAQNTLFPQCASGYGCHPNPAIALSRAILEAAQSRVTHISGLRDDLRWSRYRSEFLASTSTTAQARLAEISEDPDNFDFAQSGSAETGADALAEILQKLRRAGIHNAIVVSLAANDAFSVVYACAPDLEYQSPKASRLYTPGRRMREYLSV